MERANHTRSFHVTAPATQVGEECGAHTVSPNRAATGRLAARCRARDASSP
jgi:hypothetical protein